MPLDTSIYNVRGPDIVGNVARGLQVGELLQARQARDTEMAEQTAIKDVFKANTNPKTGEVNTAAILAGVRGINPEKALAYEQKFGEIESAKTADQMKQLDRQMKQLGFIGQIAGTIKDQGSYDQALTTLGNAGIDVSQMPKQYDPNWVRQRANMAKTLQDRLNERRVGLESRRLDIEEKKVAAKTARTPFQKKVEEEKAKDFAEKQAGIKKTNEALTAVDDALRAQQEYSQSTMFGTGPIATLGGYTKGIFQDAEALNAKLRAVDLKNMTQTFAGMSKAIDSDAERRAWQGTQANLANDDVTNMKILLGQKSILLKDKAETLAQRGWVERFGTLDGYVSPVDGEITTLVSPTGEMLLVDKDREQEAIQQGYMRVDQYAEQSTGGTIRGMSEAVAAPPRMKFEDMSNEQLMEYIRTQGGSQ